MHYVIQGVFIVVLHSVEVVEHGDWGGNGGDFQFLVPN